MKIKLLLIDLNTGEVTPTPPIRAEHGWTVAEFKQVIGEVSHISHNFVFALYKSLS